MYESAAAVKSDFRARCAQREREMEYEHGAGE